MDDEYAEALPKSLMPGNWIPTIVPDRKHPCAAGQTRVRREEWDAVWKTAFRKAMDPESIHQPHDKLFKAAFSNPETAAAFLSKHLPPSLANSIEWAALEFHPGSFIDEQLRGSEADLLFRVKAQDNEVFLYLLWEHRSSPSPLMALRLLSYMVRIWTQQAQEQGGTVKLAPILPVVLAQDKRRWKVSERFGDMFALTPERWAEVGAFTPDFAFRLLQLVDMQYEAIEGTAEGILTLRALKAEAMDELLHEVVWEAGLLQTLSLEAAERFFRYMLNAGIDKRTFERRVQQINSGALIQHAMTLADQYRQEGLELGLEQGRSLADQYRQEGLELGLERGRSLADQYRQEGLELGLERGRSLADQYRQEGLELGLERGRSLADQYRQEGLELGMERGEIQAQRRMLLAIVEARFDSLPQRLREHLEGITDKEQLALLLKSAVCCETLEAFEKSL